MCTNAVKTAGDLMAAEEPTLKALLTETNLLNTPDGQSAIAAYDAALTAVQGWTSGTDAQEVIEVIGDFQTVFATLSIPPEYEVLGNLILGGVVTVIGVLTANSPAPAAAAPADATIEPEDLQTAHQTATIADTTAKVQTLVPGFKPSIWHTPAKQYKNEWNKTVEENGLPATLKVA